MLKGTRTGVVQRVQPISIHGQMSLDVFWIYPDDPEQELRNARVGPESVPTHLEIGYRVVMHYMMGAVTQITK